MRSVRISEELATPWIHSVNWLTWYNEQKWESNSQAGAWGNSQGEANPTAKWTLSQRKNANSSAAFRIIPQNRKNMTVPHANSGTYIFLCRVLNNSCLFQQERRLHQIPTQSAQKQILPLPAEVPSNTKILAAAAWTLRPGNLHRWNTGTLI